MRESLKDIFKNVMNSLKKNLKSRDEWILKWPGQLCITASQVHILYNLLFLKFLFISIICGLRFNGRLIVR